MELRPGSLSASGSIASLAPLDCRICGEVRSMSKIEIQDGVIHIEASIPPRRVPRPWNDHGLLEAAFYELKERWSQS
jgi:hypothetical protein